MIFEEVTGIRKNFTRKESHCFRRNSAITKNNNQIYGSKIDIGNAILWYNLDRIE